MPLMVVTYNTLPPNLLMGFNENCEVLNTAEANRAKKKMTCRRPGAEPWAVFRFHYRTPQAIIEIGMETTFDNTWRKNEGKDPVKLAIPELPHLLVTPKPTKGDGEGSFDRQSSLVSSPAVPKTPTTCTKQEHTPMARSLSASRPTINLQHPEATTMKMEGNTSISHPHQFSSGMPSSSVPNLFEGNKATEIMDETQQVPISLKRRADLTPPQSPALKLSKNMTLDSLPSHPLSPTPILSQSPLSKRSSDAHRRIKQARLKRTELAIKHKEVEESLSPFLREIEELERLAVAEEQQTANEEDHLQDTVDLLRSFQTRG